MASRIIVGREACTIERIFRILRFDPSFPLFFEKWSSFAYSLELPILLVKKIKSDLLVDKNGLEDAIVEILIRWVAENGSQATLDKLIAALELNELNSSSESIRLEFNLPCKQFEKDPSLSFNQISILFQKKITDNLVKILPEVDSSVVLSRLNGMILMDLMIGKEPLYNSTFPSTPIYYVNRTIKGKEGILPEEKFVKHFAEKMENKTIILCGDQFMGKTTLFAQVGVKLKSANPKQTIIYVEFKTLLDKFRLVNGSAKLEEISFLLQHIACKNDLAKFVLDTEIRQNEKVKIQLFFDGIDGVQNDQRELTYKMLRCISEIGSIRLWISAGVKCMNEVIDALSAEAYSISPLNEAGQVELIASYLINHTSQDKLKILAFTGQCVRNIKSNKKHDLGNPLQCLLIGAACLEVEDGIIKSIRNLSPIKLQNVLNLNDVYENLLLDAAYKRSFHTMKLILSLNKFDLNCVNIRGNTPLFLSLVEEIHSDSLSKFKLLVEFGANLEHVNNEKLNLLNFAACHAHVETLDYILSFNKFDINCKDKNGNSPLFLSTIGLNNVDCLPKLKLLLERGADLDHLNKFETNLLNFASKFASADVLRYVLKMNRFDINSTNIDGETPLLFSVLQYEGLDCLRKVKMLVDRGADLEHVNKNGLSLLHRVAQYSSLDVIKYVINLDKFDITSEDKFGRTALHYAKIWDQNRCIQHLHAESKVKLLIEKGCIPQGKDLKKILLITKAQGIHF